MLIDIQDLRHYIELQERNSEDHSLFGTFKHHDSEDIVLSTCEDFQKPQKVKNKTNQKLQSFQLNVPKTVNQKKKRIRKYTSNNPDNKKGHWNHQQNLKYHYFLELHTVYFIEVQRRKVDKIFKQMSVFIETREAHQCRSHHQKIQKKWGSFSNIILNLRLQNFQKTDSIIVIEQFERMGFDRHKFFQESSLKTLEKLQNKFIVINGCQFGSNDENRTEQSIQLEINEDNILSDNLAHGMCIMMSDKYEDQFFI